MTTKELKEHLELTARQAENYRQETFRWQNAYNEEKKLRESFQEIAVNLSRKTNDQPE